MKTLELARFKISPPLPVWQAPLDWRLAPGPFDSAAGATTAPSGDSILHRVVRALRMADARYRCARHLEELPDNLRADVGLPSRPDRTSFRSAQLGGIGRW